MAIVYIILILEIVGLGLLSKTAHPLKKYFPYIIMFSMVFVMGIRYNVGVDYPHYEDIYNHQNSWHRGGVEPMWIFFMDTLRGLSFKVRTFFFITSFLYIYGYYVGFKRLSPQIYISFILFIAIDTFGEGANTIRQTCAQAILFAGSKFFFEKRFKKFLPYAIGSVVMHYSAIIGLALMFVARLRISRRVLQLLILGTFIAGPIIMQIFANFIAPIMLAIGKYRYNINDFAPGVTTGTLRYVYNLLGLIVIWLSKPNKSYPRWFPVLLNLVVIGVLIYNTFYLFMPVNRLNKYCFPYVTVLLPMLSRNLDKKSGYLIALGVSMCFLLFLFKTSIFTPYNFDFDFI